jgi:hypothetical protein
MQKRSRPIRRAKRKKLTLPRRGTFGKKAVWKVFGELKRMILFFSAYPCVARIAKADFPKRFKCHSRELSIFQIFSKLDATKPPLCVKIVDTRF